MTASCGCTELLYRRRLSGAPWAQQLTAIASLFIHHLTGFQSDHLLLVCGAQQQSFRRAGRWWYRRFAVEFERFVVCLDNGCQLGGPPVCDLLSHGSGGGLAGSIVPAYGWIAALHYLLVPVPTSFGTRGSVRVMFRRYVLTRPCSTALATTWAPFAAATHLLYSSPTRCLYAA